MSEPLAPPDDTRARLLAEVAALPGLPGVYRYFDAQGQLLFNDVIYLLGEGNSLMHAKTLLFNLVERYKIEAIAIGNGTASRETETFVNRIGLPKAIPVLMVNESGASIYSASEVAREAVVMPASCSAAVSIRTSISRGSMPVSVATTCTATVFTPCPISVQP
jgi:hypothetical protein